MMGRVSLLLLVLAVCWAGCSSPEPEAPAPAPKATPAQTPSPPLPAEPVAEAPAPVAEVEPTTSHEPREELTCYLKVVDLAGKPLAKMAPILSRTPNALDEPLAIGPPTDEAGAGYIRAAVTGNVFLRAWDPELALFPNNFYEILESSGAVARDMTITMVPASNLAVRLLLPSGAPAANVTAHLMMVHPSRGPWWPSETETNFNGLAIFERVPPGTFTIHLKTSDGPGRDVPGVELMPGGLVQLGDVHLH